MARKKPDSDEAYWKSSHSGFDFDTTDSQSTFDSRFPPLMRDDEWSEFDLLRWAGLTEVAENKSGEEFLPLPISPGENEKSASKLAKEFNPLTINQKQEAKSATYGPEETVKNMILGLDYSLVGYKAKEEKIALLNAAVKSHDGNTILEVVLYLRDTLKKSIFRRELMAHPDAVNVYLAYLEDDHEMDELHSMLMFLDRAEDAAILKYEQAILDENPERKLQRIENCLSTFQDNVNNFLWESLEEHKQVIREQDKLEAVDDISVMQRFEKLTGKKYIVDSSVLSTSIFCYLCFYHSKEMSFATPERINLIFNLTKKQSTWAALRALTALRRWCDVDDLFISKSWLGTKVRSCIVYSRLLEVLYKANAPHKVLEKYVASIECDHEKLALAKKYECHSIAFEVYEKNKDRAGLMKYKASLIVNAVDFDAIDELNYPIICRRN